LAGRHCVKSDAVLVAIQLVAIHYNRTGLEKEDPGRSELREVERDDVGVIAHAVAAYLGARSTAHLDAVLGGDRSRPGAANIVPGDKRAGAGIVNGGTVLLILVDQVLGNRGSSRLPLGRAADENRHAVLTSAERCIADFGDVVAVDRRRTPAVDANAIADAVAAKWPGAGDCEPADGNARCSVYSHD
jgi:hypothetical protein